MLERLLRDFARYTGFVQWATQQVELFSSMFLRQVQGADQEQKVLKNCLNLTKAHAMVVSLPATLSCPLE